MFRTDRHLNKKRNGQHNFFGEEEYIEVKDGTVNVNILDDDSPPVNQNVPSENESG